MERETERGGEESKIQAWRQEQPQTHTYTCTETHRQSTGCMHKHTHSPLNTQTHLQACRHI